MSSRLSRTSARVRSRLAPVLRARREGGATAVEYALMLAFIAIVIVASVMVLGGKLTLIFTNAATSF
ncbi:Flp family type IVb pilin [Phycicoccus avicenniae]|uniref:Flp family type IVb pilin n=1 Tax=Phycicoccus avicenniae TaxID=2828860 RepID=UPI003D2DB99A